MGFNLIYRVPTRGLFFHRGSLLGKIWNNLIKRAFFRAGMAGLGSKGLTQADMTFLH